MPRFFIVGTGRSGTTLLRKLMGSHPDVWVPQETHWIPILFNFFGTRKVPVESLYRVVEDVYMAKGLTALQRIVKENKTDDETFKREFLSRVPSGGLQTVVEFMEEFYRYVAERNGASICGDKTPDYGLCMRLLQDLWPRVKFLHIYRDGRDVALSMSKVLSFRYQVAWDINHWWGIAYKKQYEREKALAESDLPIDRFYELWRNRVLRIWNERDRLRGNCYLDMAYEDLLANPVKTLTTIGRFLELPSRMDWCTQAASSVMPENLKKNQTDPRYLALTRDHAHELRAMGFAVN